MLAGKRWGKMILRVGSTKGWDAPCQLVIEFGWCPALRGHTAMPAPSSPLAALGCALLLAVVATCVVRVVVQQG